MPTPGVGRRPIHEVSSRQWAAVLGSNLTGAFHTISSGAPGMVAWGHGRIVTIASMLGRGAALGRAASCASKWGVIGLTKSVLLDLAMRRITVNEVAPEYISTPWCIMTPVE
ncbi:SDR family NAD(P)-dependent oxidoreductase [Rhodococcus sp. MEB032]|uniref:SDR family NAD(P)-dependent oxidoreductase n=1 Tax=Rhodococcus sp. MEB032 TaxID=3040322 RepID=UPI0033079B31